VVTLFLGRELGKGAKNGFCGKGESGGERSMKTGPEAYKKNSDFFKGGGGVIQMGYAKRRILLGQIAQREKKKGVNKQGGNQRDIMKKKGEKTSTQGETRRTGLRKKKIL